jgi:hypothetical protein
MSAERLTAAMQAADDLTKSDGVRQKGGKQYLEVKHRITVFRQHFGLELGIETELLHACDKYVRVAAKITDAAGRVIGSGHAEEIRGSTNVNSTSPLENAETSAVGRALASLSLHGGEYASLNEIEMARAHKAALDKKPEENAEPVPLKTVSKTNDPPFDASDTREEKDWPSWCATASGEISELTTVSSLRNWVQNNTPMLTELKQERPTLHSDLLKRYTDYFNRAELKSQ